MVGERPPGILGAARLLWLVLLAVSGGTAAGQGAPPDAAPAKGPTAAAAAPSAPSVPGAEGIVLLLRTTLLTLNDALRTGNFTVLRDVGAPGFRDANPAARLSSIFGNLSQQRVDLSAVAVIVPQLAEAPAILPQTGMLRIKGYFPGEPVRIDFEVLYQSVQGRWRLFGLSVQPTPVATKPAAKKPPPSSGPAANIAAPAKK